MPTIVSQLTIPDYGANIHNDRASIRKKVVTAFIDELPGTGKGDETSRYKYEVEILQDNTKVYLMRPAVFNKGFDFAVHVEGLDFGGRTRTMPRHNDIIEDLRNKSISSAREYKQVRVFIQRIFECQNVDYNTVRNSRFREGHPIEAVLKSIKWLFIEQDVTYWNWSGRNMFYKSLIDKGLC